jgi:hypothetical protein
MASKYRRAWRAPDASNTRHVFVILISPGGVAEWLKAAPC